MPYVFRQGMLVQLAPPPKVEKPDPEDVTPKKRVDRRHKVTDETCAIIRKMWGQPSAKIARAAGISVGYVSTLAKKMDLPSRKRAPRHIGLRESDRDARLREVWGRSDLRLSEKAAYAGFRSVSGARRRAVQLNIGTTA